MIECICSQVCPRLISVDLVAKKELLIIIKGKKCLYWCVSKCGKILPEKSLDKKKLFPFDIKLALCLYCHNDWKTIKWQSLSLVKAILSSWMTHARKFSYFIYQIWARLVQWRQEVKPSNKKVTSNCSLLLTC